MAAATAIRSKPARRGLSDRTLAVMLVAPVALLLVAFELAPLLVAFRDSLYNVGAAGTSDRFVGLANFSSVLAAPDVRAAFVRSATYVTGAVALQTLVGLVTALVLDQGLRGQLVWRGLNLFPYMVPAIVTTLMFRFLFNDTYGALNYVLVRAGLVHAPIGFLSDPHLVMFAIILITSWRHTPFMTIVILARLQSVSRDLVEAAVVDGAGRMAVFRHIVLPWIAPVLLIAMLLRTIWTATEFDFPYLTAFGGPLQASTVLPIQIYSLYVEQAQVGPAAALAVSLGVLLLAASAVYLRLYARAEHATRA
jgi:multiple sugar transport system permease protein